MRINVEVFHVGKCLIRKKNPKRMISQLKAGASLVQGPCGVRRYLIWEKMPKEKETARRFLRNGQLRTD